MDTQKCKILKFSVWIWDLIFLYYLEKNGKASMLENKWNSNKQLCMQETWACYYQSTKYREVFIQVKSWDMPLGKCATHVLPNRVLTCCQYPVRMHLLVPSLETEIDFKTRLLEIIFSLVVFMLSCTYFYCLSISAIIKNSYSGSTLSLRIASLFFDIIRIHFFTLVVIFFLFFC